VAEFGENRRCEVAEKSSGIAYKKRRVRDTFWPPFRPHLAYRAHNKNNSDDRVAQHLDYVQQTWLDSTMWPPSAWSAFKTASANEQRRRGLARASQQQRQPWSAEHVSAAVPSPRGSRLRKHWCPSAVRCGHLSIAAGKVYTSPQPPVHAVGRVRCGPPLCEPPPHCLLARHEAHVNSYL